MSANLAEQVLTAAGHPATALGVYDGYELEVEMRAIAGITHVVIYAPWIDMQFIAGLCRRWPSVNFTITIHSNLAFLQTDSFAVKIIAQGAALSKQIDNFTISANNRITAQFIAVAYDVRCPYLPNMYTLDHKRQFAYKGQSNKIVLGMFGATRPLKNMMTGVGAAILVAREYKPVTLYISGGRVEGGQGILKAVDQLVAGQKHFTLKVAEWMPWDEFTKFVYTMDLMLQPSFSESFNNVTADGAAQYVSSVVTPAISWAPKEWQVTQADNTFKIAEKTVELLQDGMSGIRGFSALSKYVAKAIRRWGEYIYAAT